jgi:N-acetylneuraminic acid mutarotase
MFPAANLNDLYCFDPGTSKWASLVAVGAPSGRVRMGFTAASDGKIYVFGGYNDNDGVVSFVKKSRLST